MLDFVAVGDVMLDVRLPAPVPGQRVHTSIVGERRRVGGERRARGRAARRDRSCGRRDRQRHRRRDDRRTSSQRTAWSRCSRASTGVPSGTTVYAGDGIVANKGANAHVEITDLPPSRVTLVSAYLPAEIRAAAVAGGHGLVAVDLQGVLDDASAPIVLGPGLDLRRSRRGARRRLLDPRA